MKRPIWTMGLLLVALGVMGVVAALSALNRTVPDRGAHFTPSPDLSEAVGEPDDSFAPHLRA